METIKSNSYKTYHILGSSSQTGDLLILEKFFWAQLKYADKPVWIVL